MELCVWRFRFLSLFSCSFRKKKSKTISAIGDWDRLWLVLKMWGGHKEEEELKMPSIQSALGGNSFLISLLESRLTGVKAGPSQTHCEPPAPSHLGYKAGEWSLSSSPFYSEGLKLPFETSDARTELRVACTGEISLSVAAEWLRREEKRLPRAVQLLWRFDKTRPCSLLVFVLFQHYLAASVIKGKDFHRLLLARVVLGWRCALHAISPSLSFKL